MKKNPAKAYPKPSQQTVNAFCNAAGIADRRAILEFLDKYGAAAINAKDETSQTALMLAAIGGCADTITLLLEKGADVNARDKNGWTALMWVKRNHKNTVARLLDGGADINAQEEEGWTALMLLPEFEETIALLLEKGANIDIKNKEGDTALEIAHGWQYPKSEALIRQWPEKQRQQEQLRKEQEFARERDAITKVALGGLKRPIPYKGTFKFPPPAAGGK